MQLLWDAARLVFLDPNIWLIVCMASVFGVFMGSVPGLTATMAVALLVPVTYWLEPVPALAAIVAIVACAIFAGDIPGALLRIPGTPASAAYAADSHALTRQGKADVALGTALVCSATGGLMGALVLMLLGQQLAKVATVFGSAEYFWLYLLGLSCAVIVSMGSKINALLSLSIGLLLATVGLSAVHTEARFTFGQPELFNGISFIPAMIGLFGMSEILNNLVRLRENSATEGDCLPVGFAVSRKSRSILSRLIGDPVRDVVLAGAKNLSSRFSHAVRSGGIGVFIGMLPGAGADIAAWVSLAISKKYSKRPDLFGKGSLEGIADASTSNSAALAGAWIPALVFGIPGDSITAIVIGVLLMKNITPGPDIFANQADLVYSIYFLFILANIVLIPIGLAAIKAGSYIVRVPPRVLIPVIFLFCIVGAYSLNGSYLDIVTMLVMGVLGFFLERRNIPLAPVVLGLILGGVVEERFIQTMTGADGFFDAFLNPERPVALGLGIAFVLLWFISVVIPRNKRRGM